MPNNTPNSPDQITTDGMSSSSFPEVSKDSVSSSSNQSSRKKEDAPPKPASQDADTFNGAETSLYKWAQTQDDIDVRVSFTNKMVNRSQLKVNISQKNISVKLKNEEGVFEDYINGELFKKVENDSTWNFDPKKHELHIFLEKCKPASWWKRVSQFV